MPRLTYSVEVRFDTEWMTYRSGGKLVYDISFQAALHALAEIISEVNMGSHPEYFAVRITPYRGNGQTYYLPLTEGAIDDA